MAAFESRGRDEHRAHWDKIRADETAVLRTIVADGVVAGNVVGWLDGDRRMVGYWVGKAHWGKGIATAALQAFIAELTERPLFAWVAAHNAGSIRVLEKCGFTVAQRRTGGDVEEYLMELPAGG